MLILNAADILRLLDMASCVDAVEAAFIARGSGGIAASAVAGVPLEAGKLHAKLSVLELQRSYAVAKVNANLPGNPERLGLPAIQGVVLLFDAVTGSALAVLESGTITSMRTAAASAVAARWLAAADASSVAFIGCGVQARAHVAALRCVRPVRQLHAYDSNRKAAEAFCGEMSEQHGVECEISLDIGGAVSSSEIIVTSTPSHRPLLDRSDVAPGAFVAAVGADNEDKHEIGVALMGASVVIVDDLDQCAKMGDLHHAIAADAMSIADVRASLDQVVSQRVKGRRDDNEIIIFDSTGVAIEDAAAAGLVYERAAQAGVGVPVDLGLHIPAQISVQSSS